MKLMGKLIIIIGILLLGSSLNGISANKHKKIKRKYPVINDRRKAILSQKFNCNGKQYTVNYITDDKVQLVDTLSSGSRYSNGKIEIHIKGNEAVLNQDSKDISCNLIK